METPETAEEQPNIPTDPPQEEEVAVGDTSTEEQQKDDVDTTTTAETSDNDNMEKLREAARKRKLRRNGRRTADTADESASAETTETKEDDVKAVDPEELTKLREELMTARLEMASMRRNHVTNVQKLTRERDMFAIQLSKEQEEASPESKRGMEELRDDLRAAKLRVTNMEGENARMRVELKELRLRVTAFKTLDAANSGYESVVDDLIHVKLKLATLSAENENLIHENRVLKGDNETLNTANGLLEKSRTEWVHKCAALEKLLQAGSSDGLPSQTGQTSESRAEKSLSMSSELQELAL